ncbi:MAG: diguanylate cyclase [Desulfuromonadaceae bacterium]|nr:diguanylate cyclase [Desulfuromonadaceae bacterium]MDD5107071.1 diguanylate cyclase [Desulfuromonadaceae bacterium]
MKVLLVDPSRAVTLMLGTLLGKFGALYFTAGSGREALSVLERETVDVLCFTYELPDMDGVDFISAAKARNLIHAQPCLMFSSTQGSEITARALSAGVTECFPKHNLEKLERFIERFVRNNRRRIGGHVLLVEDSASGAAFCRHVLEQMGLRVDHCTGAEKAITLFGTHAYDLVLTDYILDGVLSGLALIGAVRESAGRKAFTPILAMSSFSDTARKVEILRSGANDFVSKPMVAEELEARVFNLISTQNLMRQLEVQHEAMKEIAMHDPLTSLHNRCYLDVAIPDLLRSVRDRGEPLSLILVDLDKFKLINDTAGHKIGDMALQRAAEVMKECCCGNDLAARIGGDEFIMILPGVDLAGAIERGEELRIRIAGVSVGDFMLTASIGVAAMLPDEDYDALFHRADSALYLGKAGGRNRVTAASSRSADDA